MTRVVISQPMYFPWVGMLEQMYLADWFVHYDDVQFSKGSFTNRVQVKTLGGPRWMTIPLAELHAKPRISEVQASPNQNWRESHVQLLQRSYEDAPYVHEMLELVRSVFDGPCERLGDVTIRSMLALYEYFELGPTSKFIYIDALDVPGSGSPRVLDVVKKLDGDVYITGHGAKNYLEHEAFEQRGVRVEYMDYVKRPYPQLHGEFTPFVSALDLVANVGRQGRDVICSGTVNWKEVVLT